MKAKRINKDIYDLSRTLYGAERFKLLLKTIDTLEKDGDYEVPQICTFFNSDKELQHYVKFQAEHFVVNIIVSDKLEKLKYQIWSYVLSIEIYEKILEKENG